MLNSMPSAPTQRRVLPPNNRPHLRYIELVVAVIGALSALPGRVGSSSAGPYVVTQRRANGNEPFISSQKPPSVPGYSVFHFNLVPVFLTLPNGSPALLVRSVNGSSYQRWNGTSSTLLNPDRITLTTFVGSASDTDSVAVEPILSGNVVLEPDGSKAEACGVQDPRIVYNAADETYYMTYASFANPLPKDPKSNPRGILCGDAWVGLATSKTPDVAGSWSRHGYNCNNGTADNCGKSAAILVREHGLHYMFFGIPTISVSVSEDLLNWRLIKSDWVVPNATEQEMWVEAGSPPMKLDDGNYIMTYNIADSNLWWGIGYLILDKDDPTKILQRGTRLIWPSLPWELGNYSASSWEPYKNCIGAMNSLHALPKKNSFLGYYAAGDAVSGAAVIEVSEREEQAVESIVWV
eukprot:gnl/TRDRNA2_/TRDRNA2_30891_c0_seq1.p1 gnl/TRDRNA2_/TRDRNA2_30891_c0~~gnl/TRDRNA2_/TRDRNA2_30891_c0_seq1.p1  ORF type:complete len:408 (-),score=51.79 gnl/TRDRNA2_/TRDRNA2_30891_c0_seq1:82-1305(-)